MYKYSIYRYSMCVSMVYTQDHKHEYVTLYGGGCGGRRSWCSTATAALKKLFLHL